MIVIRHEDDGSGLPLEIHDDETERSVLLDEDETIELYNKLGSIVAEIIDRRTRLDRCRDYRQAN